MTTLWPVWPKNEGRYLVVLYGVSDETVVAVFERDEYEVAYDFTSRLQAHRAFPEQQASLRYCPPVVR